MNHYRDVRIRIIVKWPHSSLVLVSDQLVRPVKTNFFSKLRSFKELFTTGKIVFIIFSTDPHFKMSELSI